MKRKNSLRIEMPVSRREIAAFHLAAIWSGTRTQLLQAETNKWGYFLIYEVIFSSPQHKKDFYSLETYYRGQIDFSRRHCNTYQRRSWLEVTKPSIRFIVNRSFN